jgi:hypothetical protein
MRPASLLKERLEEQIREHRLLQTDVDSHRPSVESVAQSAQELVATASNARLAKKIETKLRDVTSRYWSFECCLNHVKQNCEMSLLGTGLLNIVVLKHHVKQN